MLKGLSCFGPFAVMNSKKASSLHVQLLYQFAILEVMVALG